MNTEEHNPLHAILADLSDESPALFAFVDIVGDEPHIDICVSNGGGAWAHAVLPLDKLDLHCMADAKAEYYHPDGPLPADSSPARLEARARTLRHLESRIEEALNRIAVAEECGTLRPRH